MRRLLGEIRQADEAYGLISPGDRIAVGLSGGKDSLALLMLLHAYRQFAPHPFALHAMTIKLGEPFDTAPLAAFCRERDIPYTVRETDLLATLKMEKNPCALCARLRRGTLARMAAEAGCGLLALGHHRDDVLETYLMSALSEGRLYSLAPKARMERAGITVIRPLIDAREEAVADLCRRYALPAVPNPCPVDGHTRRAEIKALVREIDERFPGGKDNFCRALQRDRKGGEDHDHGSLR